jgi:hypothetical protein
MKEEAEGARFKKLERPFAPPLESEVESRHSKRLGKGKVSLKNPRILGNRNVLYVDTGNHVAPRPMKISQPLAPRYVTVCNRQ